VHAPTHPTQTAQTAQIVAVRAVDILIHLYYTNIVVMGRLVMFRATQEDLKIIEKLREKYKTTSAVLRAALRALAVMEEEGRLPELSWVVKVERRRKGRRIT